MPERRRGMDERPDEELEQEKDAAAEHPGLVANLSEILKVMAVAIAVALVIRVVLLQPFNIPSGSMIPTLLVGDYLVVTKFDYGYSRYSLPFRLPLFSGRMLFREPQRGDVVVFHYQGIDYIKRLIGLPGDTIQVRGGQLVLNGTPVPRRPLPPYVTRDLYGFEREVPRFEETLPNGRHYETLDLIANSAGDNTKVYLVPAGHYFMMGDNRDNSSDSRFHAPIGFVPRENLIGKARFLYFSRSETAPGHQSSPEDGRIRWRRLFKGVL
jgi:signal peptidase I